MIAKDIMTKKVITVGKNTSIEEVIKVLVDNEISGVPVLEEDDCLVGLVSEGDLIYMEGSLMPVSDYPDRKKFSDDHSKAVASTAEVAMTKDVITVDEETTVEKVASILLKHKIKRVPVTRDRKVIGIVSRADVMKAIAKKMDE